MPLEIGSYGVGLKPVFAFGALTGVFPASKGTGRRKFNFSVLLVLAATLFFAMYRFSRFFLLSWKAHDKRETSLNLTNVLILSANFVAAMAIPYTSLLKPERVHLILQGLQRQSRILRFEKSQGHAALRRRVWRKSVSAFLIMSFLFVWEPFLWPDYFLLVDLIGRLWSAVAIALMEMQVVCICDSFKEIFRSLNANLAANKIRISTLRKVHDDLCDSLCLFQDHYGLYILTNILYLFCSLTFGFYFSIVGIFQNLPDVEKIIKQAFISDFWLGYACYRTVNLVNQCSGCLAEAGKTGMVISKLLHSPVGSTTRRELCEFTQQIQHRTYKFYATGTLLLDNALLFETIGAVTTYFLIMVQFQNSL